MIYYINGLFSRFFPLKKTWRWSCHGGLQFIDLYFSHLNYEIAFSHIVLFHVFMNSYWQCEEDPVYHIAKFGFFYTVWNWGKLVKMMYRLLSTFYWSKRNEFSTQVPLINTSRFFGVHLEISNICWRTCTFPCYGRGTFLRSVYFYCTDSTILEWIQLN